MQIALCMVVGVSNPQTNVVVAGGRKLFREGLCLLLERQPNIHVTGEAEEPAQAVRLVKAMSVQVVILSLAPPSHTDAEVVAAIVRARPSVRVVVLTLSPAIEYVQGLMEAGATACLTKECAGAELVAAVEKVVTGGVYLSPTLVDRIVSRYVQRPRQRLAERPLAPRERQVLRMIAAGHTAKEIAVALSVSNKTVETHRRRIMEKLNRRSIAELTKYAVMEGLTSLETSS